ncbi:LysR family transcriptional regulator [Alcaligenaceae bacterium]|nr:LysR family transcriptional regulator [Alcaligenaceae bacterium]
MTIDLRSLKYFISIAENGSLSRAAEEQHIAQPALTAQLKKMEANLNVSLFQRNARGVTLTEPGARFLFHARDILDRFRIACEEAKQSGGEPTGRVSLGLPQSMGAVITAALVKQCSERWPKVKLQIMEAASGDIPMSLMRHSMDMGIVYIKSNGRDLQFSELISEELVLLGPPRRFPSFPINRPGNAAKVRLVQLENFPLILPVVTNGLRRLIETTASASGVKLQTIADVDSIPQIINLVGAGHCYSILSYSAVVSALRDGTVSVARLTEPKIIRKAHLCHLRDLPLSQAALSVKSLLEMIVEDLVQQGHWPGASENFGE